MDTNLADTNSKKRVLVVDDDDNLRNILIDALAGAGFEAKGASNGEEGLKVALESHPDAMMLDVMMPKMDGWQVLEKLRADSWGKGAKVIMLTSLGQMDNIAHAVDNKVFNYIVKSDLNLDNLANTVNALINSSLT
jgi:DNA-binding response OmpR family regulator